MEAAEDDRQLVFKCEIPRNFNSFLQTVERFKPGRDMIRLSFTKTPGKHRLEGELR